MGREAVLDLVYEAAVDARLWPRLLEEFARLLGGHGAAVRAYFVPNEDGGVLTSPGLDGEGMGQLFRRFADVNPLKSSPEVLRQLMQKPPGGYRPGHKRDVEWLPKAQFVRTEYYSEVYRPLDIHSDISIGLDSARGFWTGIDVYRAERQGPFTPDDIAACDAVHPHLVRAHRLSRRLADGLAVGQGLAAAFDASPHGLVLLSRSGVVRHMNRAAAALTGGAGGLRVSGGRLTCGGEPGRQLARLIAAAADAHGVGGSLAVPAPARTLPLSLIVAPIPAEQAAPFHDGPAVMVCVTDLEAGLSLPQQRMCDLFGLTTGQARVAAALFEGHEPDQAAAQLGLSLATVRSHMAQIFAKTQTAGQPALARLMMRVLGAVA
jgi:DNA-binding CsgD family transcriptional regulator/PAS domain-containing protein